MTAPKPKAPEVAPAQVEPNPEDLTPSEPIDAEKLAQDEAPQTVTVSLEALAKLVDAKVAEALAALPKGTVSQATPAVPFQSVQFDKGSEHPKIVMTLGDPDTDGRVETRVVQKRHAHILAALGWTAQS